MRGVIRQHHPGECCNELPQLCLPAGVLNLLMFLAVGGGGREGIGRGRCHWGTPRNIYTVVLPCLITKLGKPCDIYNFA